MAKVTQLENGKLGSEPRRLGFEGLYSRYELSTFINSIERLAEFL